MAMKDDHNHVVATGRIERDSWTASELGVPNAASPQSRRLWWTLLNLNGCFMVFCWCILLCMNGYWIYIYTVIYIHICKYYIYKWIYIYTHTYVGMYIMMCLCRSIYKKNHMPGCMRVCLLLLDLTISWWENDGYGWNTRILTTIL